MESVHGHEVLHTMLENDKGWTRATLLQALTEKYGENCRFHTCSAENMTADELIHFLQTKGKFVETGEVFNTAEAKICKH